MSAHQNAQFGFNFDPGAPAMPAGAGPGPKPGNGGPGPGPRCDFRGGGGGGNVPPEGASPSVSPLCLGDITGDCEAREGARLPIWLLAADPDAEAVFRKDAPGRRSDPAAPRKDALPRRGRSLSSTPAASFSYHSCRSFSWLSSQFPVGNGPLR